MYIVSYNDATQGGKKYHQFATIAIAAGFFVKMERKSNVYDVKLFKEV